MKSYSPLGNVMQVERNMWVSFLSREVEVRTWVLELRDIMKKKQNCDIELGSSQVTSYQLAN